MRTKLIIGGLLATVALSPVAAQQTPEPATPPAQRMETPAMPPAQRMETPATPPAATTTTTTDVRPATASGQWRASKLVGVDVYNAANEKIGDISEILLDASGKVAGVIIGVGGFLGIGQHDVQVQLSELRFVNEPRRTTTATTTSTTTTGATTRPARDANERWYPDHAVMNATKDQLKAMPAFKYN